MDRTWVEGAVVKTTASRDLNRPTRRMMVRLADNTVLTGIIPVSIREAATTLMGRMVLFRAEVDTANGTFKNPIDGTILAPSIGGQDQVQTR